MLPVARVIGHKEYGNTPPGGWAGRKQDPVYDMNWRRARVANFRPRTAGAVTPPPQQEDDMPLTDREIDTIAERVWRRPLPENHGVPILHLLGLTSGVSALLSRPGVDVDEAQIARELAPLLKLQVASLSQADLEGIAKAVADEQARRQAA